MRLRLVWMLAVGAAWSAACSGTIATQGSGTTTSTGTAASSATAGAGAGGAGSTSSSGAGGSTGSAGGGLASPPPPGPAHAPDGTGTTVFAVSKIYLGDTDPDGAQDPQNGWTHYGYNVDGLPASDLSAFCAPAQGANASTLHQQGIGGIENSFGHNILPLVVSNPTPPLGIIPYGIAGGQYTMLILLQGLGPGSSYDPLPSNVAQAGNLGAVPKFDGTDAWPVVAGTTIGFSSPYVVGDTWVSGTSLESATGPFVLPIDIEGFTLTLKILLPRFTMKLDPTHTKATGGVLSGVLLTSDFQAEIQAVAGELDPSLCSGSTLQTILAAIAQASDILHDGTQDPTKPCDAITIGLGFDAVQAELGATVPPPPPPPDPCP